MSPPGGPKGEDRSAQHAGATGSLPAGHAIAGYRLQRLIGQGSHGKVYLAEHAATAQAVALKVVPLESGAHAGRVQAAFLLSTAIGRRLRHPGIVALHAAGVEGTVGWLAMEPVPGSDLGRYVRASRLLPEALVLRVGAKVAQALAHAHGQGVVHRDLKPANVLVHWPDGTVKLTDFGLARADDAATTGTGIVLGTPAYMAPEQLAGGVPTPHSDFYALGVMLFQLLAGRLPHDSHSMGELLQQVAAAPAPDLRLLCPALPRPAAALVAQLLCKRPADRPGDGDALAQALLSAAGPLPAAE